MENKDSSSLQRILEWHSGDIEQRIGFKGAKYTDVNPWCALVLSVVLCGVYFGILNSVPDSIRNTKAVAMMLDRGWTPYVMAVLSIMSLVILGIKAQKLSLQMKALDIEVVPRANEFNLTPESSIEVLKRMRGLIDDPKRFIVFNRIERALMNLRNIGNVSDVSEMLRSQAETDENNVDASYSLLRGFIWAIPILGFIGTVIGLSAAIGQFGSVLNADANISSLKDGLTPVTENLGVAFDTTFVALVLALVIQMVMTMLQKKEEMFLDDCRDYSHCHVISRLRLRHDEAKVETETDPVV